MNHHFQTGDIVETIIEKVAFGGDGVGKTDDLVIFIPHTAEGDRVRAQITSAKKNYLRGDLREILSPSPFRIAPKCRYYAHCGGCHYQHISYDHQLQIKRMQVTDALERIGRVRGISVGEVLASGHSYGYRDKAEFHIGRGRGGNLQIGFMNQGGYRPVDIESCEIMDESINRSYARIRRQILAKWDQGGRGLIEEQNLIVWSDQEKHPVLEEDHDAPRFFTRQVGGRSLQTPPDGFFQANGKLLDRLIDTVVTAGGPQKADSVLDAYCGSGLFSLFIAPYCDSVLGIEINPDAVGCAVRNAVRWGIANASFREGRFEEEVPKLKREGFRPDLVILDPPRTGCERGVMEGLSALGPERIVYVSCDPVTQARDIAVLVGNGYRLDRVQPFDMFPQTKHIEAVATLRRS